MLRPTQLVLPTSKTRDMVQSKCERHLNRCVKGASVLKNLNTQNDEFRINIVLRSTK